MAKAKRRTTEELIAFHTQLIKELKEKQKASKVVLFDKDSAGVQQAIEAVTNVASVNKVTIGEVIKLIAKIKKTGLRIQDPVEKTRKPKSDQNKVTASST